MCNVFTQFMQITLFDIFANGADSDNLAHGIEVSVRFHVHQPLLLYLNHP